MGCVTERLPTVATSVRLPLRGSFMMCLQVGCIRKQFPTVRTFIRCLSSVCSWMETQLRLRKEGSPTHVANERSLYSVGYLLLIQNRVSREGRPAFAILNWLVLRKNVLLCKQLLGAENVSKLITFTCVLSLATHCTDSIRTALCEAPTRFNHATGLLCGTALMFTICLEVRLPRFFNWATSQRSLLCGNEVGA